MLKKSKLILIIAACLVLFCINTALAADAETVISLSDSGIKVDGSSIPTSSSASVYAGAEIVYYESGKGSAYGEGTTTDEHTAAEAAAHTVVTITKAGTYRITGTLSAGQLAVDLGSNAATDPNAKVTLILDNLDITCTVAPAIIFYNVYECSQINLDTATSQVDTSKAGANAIIADGSVNKVKGSYVARIYKEGSTSKLHKYDGAFYSKMSMNVDGEALGTGKLSITAANEGLDSELHLTINGGNIWIEAQDDGINTNEDFVSVTTINGGYLYLNAGLGSEGDGIDSNGFLVINGGTIISLANPKTGDGGIDADMDILLNGGTVIALGSRNDAASSNSAQTFMELSFATTQKAGTVIRIEDESGNALLTFAPQKDYQSLTFTSPGLGLNKTYHVYSGGTVSNSTSTDGLYSGGTYAGGTQQQYTGNSFGGGGFMGGGMGGERPQGEAGATPPADAGTTAPPDEGKTRPADAGTTAPPDAGKTRPADAGTTAPPDEGKTRPADEGTTRPSGEGMIADGTNTSAISGEGSVDFIITSTTSSFSGVSDSPDASGKTLVQFSLNNGSGMSSVSSGESPVLTSITATDKSGNSVTIPSTDIQITITDVPSENYAKSGLLAQGIDALQSILPVDDGTYQITVAILSSNTSYTGASQWRFNIGGLPYVDIDTNNPYYESIKNIYNLGIMNGTSGNEFSPSTSVNRAMAITVLGRLAKAETLESTAFTDIAKGSWYSSYVGWASNNQIVAGYGDGLYGPTDAVTRQQICLIIYNYASSIGISLTESQPTYADSSEIADWAIEAVGACQASGLLAGLEGQNFAPETPLKRGELADLVTRLANLK